MITNYLPISFYGGTVNSELSFSQLFLFLQVFRLIQGVPEMAEMHHSWSIGHKRKVIQFKVLVTSESVAYSQWLNYKIKCTHAVSVSR